MGYALADGGLYKDIDLIIPVPLHPFRRWHRGYNQAEYLAEGIAQALKCPVSRNNLIRKRYNRSQAHTSQRDQRWDNVQNIFAVRHPDRFADKHLLLVDDVLTTGATLVSCCNTFPTAGSASLRWLSQLTNSSDDTREEDYKISVNTLRCNN